MFLLKFEEFLNIGEIWVIFGDLENIIGRFSSKNQLFTWQIACYTSITMLDFTAKYS